MIYEVRFPRGFAYAIPYSNSDSRHFVYDQFP